MARKTWTVQRLSEVSGLDLEQVLLALWGEGIEYPNDPKSIIRQGDSKLAERVVGIHGSEKARVVYWTTNYQIDFENLTNILQELGFRLNPLARNLPRGAVRRLEKYFSEETPAADIPREDENNEHVKQTPLPFTWYSVGQTREVRTLSTEEVRSIHRALEDDFRESNDPISPPGIKSLQMLESAVERQTAGFDGILKYTTVPAVAAALLHSLVHNHPFYNGNKRTALVSMLVLLDENNHVMESDEDSLFREMLRVAGHDLLDRNYHYTDAADREVFEISKWIQRSSRTVKREEKVLTWIRLQKILKNHGCELTKQGERVDIVRVKLKRGNVFSRKPRSLHSHFINTGSGRDVPRSHLQRIRRDLELDEKNGVDSSKFYDGSRGADDFIAEYSKLLKRLSKV